MLPEVPITSASVLVALAMIGGVPNNSSAGKVISVPPPATALMAPPAAAAIIKPRISVSDMPAREDKAAAPQLKQHDARVEYSIATRPGAAYRAGMVPKVHAPYSYSVFPADGGEAALRVAPLLPAASPEMSHQSSVMYRRAAPRRAIGLALALMSRGLLAAAVAGQPPLANTGLPGLLAVSAATNPAIGGSGTEASPEMIEAKLAEARANLAALAPDAGTWTNALAGIPPQDIFLRRALYQRLVMVYEQQLSANAEFGNLKSHKPDLLREAQSWTGFSEPRPYSILLSDGLREDIQAERLKINNGESALSVLDELIEGNRQLLTQAEEKIRLLNDQLEGGQNSAARLRLSWQRDQAGLAEPGGWCHGGGARRAAPSQ